MNPPAQFYPGFQFSPYQNNQIPGFNVYAPFIPNNYRCFPMPPNANMNFPNPMNMNQTGKKKRSSK